MRAIEFVKMHGNGNDFVIIDETEKETIRNKSSFAINTCDRRFGIGADGILFVSRPIGADLGMRLLQPDGSEAEMCGNGIRLSRHVRRRRRICEAWQRHGEDKGGSSRSHC